ncbi:PQQ-dependent sugar dehydrogenase [Marinimicrobium alkaliphilum]|uniref:PQQ-dependent sugar dehydrogenase n=1 Tax=Marinimicrobium alkaliphilum TaxID=2202654 RepID=UPI000DB9A468|nr:PQQ-dependent sugar dehydrogenase [Marinimicrobium alkaliphilum]
MQSPLLRSFSRRARELTALTLGTFLLAACAHSDNGDALIVETEEHTLAVTTVTDGLNHPWGLAFLPNGDMLVTERGGDMRVVSADGTKGDPLAGLPAIQSRGQGGLLDVTLHPNFEQNRRVYFAYSEPGDGGASTAVAYGTLGDGGLTDVTRIFSQVPKLTDNGHWGSRLVFDDEGHLFITLGDRRAQDEAQSLENHIGTVVRLHDDGRIPEDNPYVDHDTALPEIWSYGHRNIQGADLHPQTRELWTGEHGPQGGDEINHTRATLNYGWPVITHGEQYGGGTIGEGITHKEGMEQPLHYWVPSIANAGMTFYTGEAFPAWQGNLLVTALRSQLLSRLVFDGEDVAHEERMFSDTIGARLRHVVQGPDGLLYLLTDERNGRILKVAPASE